MAGMGSEDEEDEMMAVEGSDGQQYVVLEVIQLADGEEQAMVVGDGTSEILSENIIQHGGKYNIKKNIFKVMLPIYLISYGNLNPDIFYNFLVLDAISSKSLLFETNKFDYVV